MRQLQGLAFGVAGAVALLAMTSATSHATAITIGGYYEEGSNRESQNPPTAGQCLSNGCYWFFNVVAAGKQLVVTDVSCRILTAPQAVADAMIEFTLMSQTNGQISDRAHHFKPPTHTLSGGSYAFVFKETTTKLYRAGDRPLVRAISNNIAGGTDWVGDCTISGRIGSPPN